MASPASRIPSPRRSARDVIDAVVENMRHNVEPLKYSALVPARYLVYLHPAEFARLAEILPILREQTSRALDDELGRRNAGSLANRLFRRVFGRLARPAPGVENPGGTWHIEFLADPDGEVAEGDILVQSDLVLGGREEPGAGQRTRRISTRHAAGRTEVQLDTSRTWESTGRPVARLRYQDDSGSHVYEMVADSITIGRGAAAHRVDVRIDSSADVSREHLSIRMDPSGRFFVSDLSMLGTTVNGSRLPRGYDEVDGVRKATGVETPLPDRSRITLADTVVIDFEILARS
jgi:pSer/pThr/pTyr-binding forkhead associated (FHA) protein